MLFKKELIEQIVKGRKTQTRRPVKDGEWLDSLDWGVRLHSRTTKLPTSKGRMKVRIGKDYSVCGGRGWPCTLWKPESGEIYYPSGERDSQHFVMCNGYVPLRILITDIRREDVRGISSEDAEAEGFRSEAEFLLTWCGFYDKRIRGLVQTDGVVLWVDGAGVPCASDVVDFGGWLITTRPAELYQAWAYTFEVLR